MFESTRSQRPEPSSSALADVAQPVTVKPSLTTTPERSKRQLGSRSILGLVIVLSAVFLGKFDFFVVNVAGPTIRSDLHTNNAALELIVGGYAFAYAAGLITAGRLGDLLGYRRLFIIGTTAFGLASLLCSLSQTSTQLVAARLLQGASASVMVPQVLAYITTMVAPNRRGGAIAWYAVTASIGSTAGEVFGGLLVVYNGGLGWRMIFLVNVPVAMAAALVAALVLPPGNKPQRAQFDPYGALGVTATLAAVLVPLTLGPTSGWPTWTAWCFAAAPILGAATIVCERRVARRGGSPVVPAQLLRIPSYVAGLSASAAFTLFFPSFIFALTLLLQDGLRLDPLAAGLTFVPSGITFALGSLYARKMYRRFGLLGPLLGCALTAAGLGVLVAMTIVNGSDMQAIVVPALTAVAGLGNGLVTPTLTTVTLSDVPGNVAGAASGLMESLKQFAGAAGVALIGTVYFEVARHHKGIIGSVHGATAALIIDIGLVAIVASSLLFVRYAHARSRAEVEVEVA